MIRRTHLPPAILVMGVVALGLIQGSPAAAQPLLVGHLAGPIDGGPGYADGTGSAARFYYPYHIVADAANNLYVTDSEQHVIRKVTPAGVVTTVIGQAGLLGTLDGTASVARFNRPTGIALDSSGNIFVADTNSHTIRKITPGGVVSTFAGSSGQTGAVDATGSAARFNTPYGLAIDASNNLYVADCFNHTIRMITPSGVVTTLAGQATVSGTTDGTGTGARFNQPIGVAIEAGGGALYVSDTQNHTIRKVTLPGGVVTTIAGQAGVYGSSDGIGTAAHFYYPEGLSLDASNNVYVADAQSCTLRRISPGASVTTVAGAAGVCGAIDGTGSAARFSSFTGVVAAPSGMIYVADWSNNVIRAVTSGGEVTTLAGTPPAPSGAADGTGTAARFYNPYGVATDAAGYAYVADRLNCTVRKITPGGYVSTLAGSPGYCSEVDGTGSAARFNYPHGLAVDASGNVFVADFGGHTIRKITSSGVVTTFAGLANTQGSADGVGTAARFKYPFSVAIDPATSTLYVTDSTNYTIRAITVAGSVTTLAGSAGQSGSVDGAGSAARFASPRGIALGPDGALYVTENSTHTIRRVTTGGAVTTAAGQTLSCGSTDGTGTAARFCNPSGIAFDNTGGAYVVDPTYRTIRRMAVPGYAVTTVAGYGSNYRLTGHKDGVGPYARFNYMVGIAFNPATRQLLVGDTFNHSIRRLSRPPRQNFDTDGAADVAVYRPASGTWFWLKSSQANTDYAYRGWGVEAEGDTPVRGDFDGDGVIDPTVFRPASGTWFILKSSSSYTDWQWFGWGTSTDTLMPGDYDGDGLTDAAVYRSTTGDWYVRPSSGAAQINVVFGQAGDVPVPGDFDGDGRTDIAVYRPSTGTWFILASSTNFTQFLFQGWGVDAQGDVPVPADYDGDAKTDMAVFRPGSGTWFILKSSSNNTDWMWDGWGVATDVLVPGDYNGDGKADLAVYRPSDFTWYVKPSDGTTAWSVVFGQSGDTPLQRVR